MNAYIFGGGPGAELVIRWMETRLDEFGGGTASWLPSVIPVGIFDDSATKQNTKIMGVPVIGNMTDALVIFVNSDNEFGLICSSSNVRFREQVWDVYRVWGTWLNCDRSGVNCAIGQGNIIFPDVSTDWFTTIGNNNVISAGCVIAHHNKIGSHNLFGPGCLFSGSVTIGSGCRFGSGIVVQPNVTIGDYVDIPSGTVIVSNIPDYTAIKAKTVIGQPLYSAERIVRMKNYE